MTSLSPERVHASASQQHWEFIKAEDIPGPTQGAPSQQSSSSQQKSGFGGAPIGSGQQFGDQQAGGGGFTPGPQATFSGGERFGGKQSGGTTGRSQFGGQQPDAAAVAAYEAAKTRHLGQNPPGTMRRGPDVPQGSFLGGPQGGQISGAGPQQTLNPLQARGGSVDSATGFGGVRRGGLRSSSGSSVVGGGGGGGASPLQSGARSPVSPLGGRTGPSKGKTTSSSWCCGLFSVVSSGCGTNTSSFNHSVSSPDTANVFLRSMLQPIVRIAGSVTTCPRSSGFSSFTPMGAISGGLGGGGLGAAAGLSSGFGNTSGTASAAGTPGTAPGAGFGDGDMETYKAGRGDFGSGPAGAAAAVFAPDAQPNTAPNTMPAFAPATPPPQQQQVPSPAGGGSGIPGSGSGIPGSGSSGSGPSTPLDRAGTPPQYTVTSPQSTPTSGGGGGELANTSNLHTIEVGPGGLSWSSPVTHISLPIQADSRCPPAPCKLSLLPVTACATWCLHFSGTQLAHDAFGFELVLCTALIM